MAILLAWLVETICDTFLNIRGGIHEHLMGAASRMTWMTLGFYVPMWMVSLVLIIWQLYSRHGEAFAASVQGEDAARAAAPQRVTYRRITPAAR